MSPIQPPKIYRGLIISEITTPLEIGERKFVYETKTASLESKDVVSRVHDPVELSVFPNR